MLDRAALELLDALLERLHLDQPEAGDELLGLGERPVHHGLLVAVEVDPGALGAGLEAAGVQQRAGDGGR